MAHENVVEAYFAAWLAKDASVLPSVFAHDVVYSECYGPEYYGLNQIKRWFADWNRRGTVLRWDIKNMISAANNVCVEWYFCCEYDGNTDGFDGVSWIEFDEHGKIKALREFQSKAEHCFPYDEAQRRETCSKEST